LVLNENYLPLNICKVRRAVVLVLVGKAEVVENGRGYFSASSGSYEIPSVIRLVYLVRKQTHPRKMTKLEIFNRDKYTFSSHSDFIISVEFLCCFISLFHKR
jgi:hypothetical protein